MVPKQTPVAAFRDAAGSSGALGAGSYLALEVEAPPLPELVFLPAGLALRGLGAGKALGSLPA